MIKTRKLPCVEEKCLKYPVCKHKKVVMCHSLRNYFVFLKSYYYSLYLSKGWSIALEDLKKDFPNIENVGANYEGTSVHKR